MPYKELKIEKHFYSISEVAAMFGVNISLIRYWENEFTSLKPYKTKKGNRMFTKEDINHIRLIYHLVKERGMTLKGAQKKLSENFEDANNNFEVVKKLQEVRTQLTELIDELE